MTASDYSMAQISTTSQQHFCIRIDLAHMLDAFASLGDIGLIDVNGICPEKSTLVGISKTVQSGVQILGDMESLTRKKDIHAEDRLTPKV
jgi:hypothetical protein